MKFLRILFILLIAAFVVMQFFGIDRNNPEFDQETDFLTIENPPAEMEKIITSSCYDCHSNQTVWPWYSYIAPASWLIEDHVIEGRDNLNFSDWGTYELEDRAYIIEEMIEEIEEGEMPFPGYDKMHPDAKLTEEQKQALFTWLRSIQKLES
jgi:hypothetical protein